MLYLVPIYFYVINRIKWIVSGIMTEVLEAVLDYAFDRVGFNRVQAEVFYGNDASSAVLKKCGMVLEGIARQKYYKKW